MPSKNNPITTALTIPAAIIAFLAPATPYAQTAPSALSALSNAYVLPGIYASYNIREGYRKFDGGDKYMHVENTDPFIFGLTVGRRVSIDNPRLRFQAVFELGRGSVKDGEYEVGLTNGSTIWASMNSVYWTGGLLADAHLLFPAEWYISFVSAGLGAHLTYFNTAWKVLDTGEDIKGGTGGMRGAISPSVNLGYGLEYMLNGRRWACISYNIRFWRSASYKEVSDPFPMGVNYTEYFFSQSIQLQYLLPKRNRN